jgi:hypothetical protein
MRRPVVERAGTRRTLAGLLLLASCIIALSGPAMASDIQQYGWVPPKTPDLTGYNATLLNATPAVPQPTLAPVTLLHLELNETTPSGVRYMAFGPKVIEVALSPVLLGLIVVLIAGAGGAWYILGRRRGGD